MLSNELKSKINKLWDKFWSRGMTNPITAIEQISYLLFIRRIDDTDVLEKAKAIYAEQKFKSIFEGFENCRWSNFSALPSEEMFRVVSEEVFPFIKKLNDPAQPYSRHMQKAIFTISNATLLKEAVDTIDEIYDDIKAQQGEGQQFQDTQGDVYEYLLNELNQSGKNGQFRTPRHLIQFICEIIEPSWTDKICDPACGTGGFLLGAYQYILTQHTSPNEIIIDENGFKRYKRLGGNQITSSEIRDKINEKTFFGFDIDQTMVRIGLMNLMLHGIKVPQIENLDALSKQYDQHYQDKKYSIVMANPPFTGKIDKEGMSDQLEINGTQTELLFLSRISKMLIPKGKAAVIIPEGVLFGSSKTQQQTREILLKDNCLEAVISLPAGAFKPYTGVKTSILLFTKPEKRVMEWNTERVWFYELKHDGYSLDDNRRKLTENPLPEARDIFKDRERLTLNNRIGYFYVGIDEIKENGFDLTYNRYKKFEYEEQIYESPQHILKALFQLEREIQKDMDELNSLIG